MAPESKDAALVQVSRTKSGRRILATDMVDAAVNVAMDQMVDDMKNLASTLHDDQTPVVAWEDEDDTMVHHVAELRRVAAS